MPKKKIRYDRKNQTVEMTLEDFMDLLAMTRPVNLLHVEDLPDIPDEQDVVPQPAWMASTGHDCRTNCLCRSCRPGAL